MNFRESSKMKLERLIGLLNWDWTNSELELMLGLFWNELMEHFYYSKNYSQLELEIQPLSDFYLKKKTRKFCYWKFYLQKLVFYLILTYEFCFLVIGLLVWIGDISQTTNVSLLDFIIFTAEFSVCGNDSAEKSNLDLIILAFWSVDCSLNIRNFCVQKIPKAEMRMTDLLQDFCMWRFKLFFFLNFLSEFFETNWTFKFMGNWFIHDWVFDFMATEWGFVLEYFHANVAYWLTRCSFK